MALPPLESPKWHRTGAAFAYGVASAFTSVLALVLFGTFVGIGAFAHDSGFTLAWVLAKSTHIVPIPGTKRRNYLEQNAAAADIQLTLEDVNGLDQLFAPDAVAGARYPEDMMKWLDRT